MKVDCLASGSSGNCYIVTDGHTRIMLECGLSFSKIMKKSGFSIPKYCLISHEHMDHCRAWKDLFLYGVKVCSSRGTTEALDTSKYINILEPLKQFVIETLNVMPFNVAHDAAEPFGYVIASRITGEQLLFATDTYYLKYRFANISHFLIECNFDRETLSPDCDDKHLERVFESHFSLQDLLWFFEANDLTRTREIYLCHLSDDNLDHEKAKREVEEATGVPVKLCLREGGVI